MTPKVPARARGILRKRAERSYVARTILLPVESFIQTAGLGGAVLLTASVAALVWANSPWADSYTAFWEQTRLSFEAGPLEIENTLRELVNSGLMAVFFFVVGLEVKRELLEGQLSEPRKAALPAIAAVGGMVIPVAIYLSLTLGDPGARGWGIPMATDIAFALGVLALLGPGIPAVLRTLLLTMAVADDIGTVLVIAFFYSSNLSFTALGIAAGFLVVMLLMQRLGIRSGWPHVLVGFLFWAAVHQSGVHATIAGVVLGFVTPLRSYYDPHDFRETAGSLLDRFDEAWSEGEDEEEAEVVLGRMGELVRDTEPPLDRALRLVHPWSSFFVLPIFALANAGIEFSGSLVSEAVRSPVTLGVVAGLLVGKTVGITGFSWIALRLKLAHLPQGVRLRHLLGLGLLAGIGFTVSIFVAGIAFGEQELARAKVGILGASVVAGVLGWLHLRLFGAASD